MDTIVQLYMYVYFRKYFRKYIHVQLTVCVSSNVRKYLRRYIEIALHRLASYIPSYLRRYTSVPSKVLPEVVSTLVANKTTRTFERYLSIDVPEVHNIIYSCTRTRTRRPYFRNGCWATCTVYLRRYTCKCTLTEV